MAEHQGEVTKARKHGQGTGSLSPALRAGRHRSLGDFRSVDFTISKLLLWLRCCIHSSALSLISNERTWAPVNLDRLQFWIQAGRISCSEDKPVTARELLLSGCIHGVADGIKLLAGVCVCHRRFILLILSMSQFPQGSTTLTEKIHVRPNRASIPAIKAIEKVGGSVVCIYQNSLSLRDSVKANPERKSAAPTRRGDIRQCCLNLDL